MKLKKYYKTFSATTDKFELPMEIVQVDRDDPKEDPKVLKNQVAGARNKVECQFEINQFYMCIVELSFGRSIFIDLMDNDCIRYFKR